MSEVFSREEWRRLYAGFALGGMLGNPQTVELYNDKGWSIEEEAVDVADRLLNELDTPREKK